MDPTPAPTGSPALVLVVLAAILAAAILLGAGMAAGAGMRALRRRRHQSGS